VKLKLAPTNQYLNGKEQLPLQLKEALRDGRPIHLFGREMHPNRPKKRVLLTQASTAK